MRKTSNLLSAVTIALAAMIALPGPARADPAPACDEGPSVGSSECRARSSVASLDSTATGASSQATGVDSTATGSSDRVSSGSGTDAEYASQTEGSESTAVGRGTIASRRAPRATRCRCPRTPEPQ